MSRDVLWQICHKKEFSNKQLTRSIVKMLRTQGINAKQAAWDLAISVERVRNWYYKDTGMTASDLLRILHGYEFIRQVVESSCRSRSIEPTDVTSGDCCAENTA